MTTASNLFWRPLALAFVPLAVLVTVAVGAPHSAGAQPSSSASASDSLEPVRGERFEAGHYSRAGTYDFRGRVPMSEAEAQTRLEMHARRDDPVAQFILGDMYFRGSGGVRQDFAEATRWFERSAENGYGAAMNNLGVVYARGLSRDRDYEMAARWFREGAELGDGIAQYNLAGMLAMGRGVERDYAEAYKWANLAVRSVPTEQSAHRQRAEWNRDMAANHLTSVQMAAAENEALEWLANAELEGVSDIVPAAGGY